MSPTGSDMPPPPNDEWFRLLASWSKELLSATDRIHYLIGNRHQPTKGSYREALLRRLLRRILPSRFRVSTGFIYRWNEPPTRQIDVLIWDAQDHSALLEEGELAILSAEAVCAIIEVKSILNPSELRDALDLLSPSWLIKWRYTSESSQTGIRQQVPDVPFRAVFAYSHQNADIGEQALSVFTELATFYRERYGDDAQRAIEHTGGHLEWSNLIDVICIADGPQIEQTCVTIDCSDGCSYRTPGFAAYVDPAAGESLAVGRFCMCLLSRLVNWQAAEAARKTLCSPAIVTTPGVCCFGQLPGQPERVRFPGSDGSPQSLWCPNPALWHIETTGL